MNKVKASNSKSILSKKDWGLIGFLIVFVWGADYITKMWALETIKSTQSYGYLTLSLHRNPGAMLGMFANLPPVLRIVSLSTGGAFIFFIYTFIQFLLPQKSLSLRAGMSILLGGILGNVTDRVLWGSVVDFIILGKPGMSTGVFNVSDALQWIGYGLIVYNLIINSNQLWPTANERKNVWIKPAFQYKYILTLLAIGLCFTLISGVFTFTYLKITINDLVLGPSGAMQKKFMDPFLLTYFFICSAFMISLFVIGRILSHRTAGPLYAFEMFLEDIARGKNRKFKLRSGDDLIHLEDLAEKIRRQFESHKIEHQTEKPTLYSKIQRHRSLQLEKLKQAI